MEIPEKERKRGRGKRGEIMKEAERKTRQTRLTQSDAMGATCRVHRTF